MRCGKEFMGFFGFWADLRSRRFHLGRGRLFFKKIF